MEIFNIDHNSVLPLHHQVEDMLRRLIQDPEYKDGKLLPNEVDIAKKLGISRNTVRQATNKACLRAIAREKKGRGY